MPPVFGNVVLLRAEGAPFIRPVAFPALQGTRLELIGNCFLGARRYWALRR